MQGGFQPRPFQNQRIFILGVFLFGQVWNLRLLRHQFAFRAKMFVCIGATCALNLLLLRFFSSAIWLNCPENRFHAIFSLSAKFCLLMKTTSDGPVSKWETEARTKEWDAQNRQFCHCERKRGNLNLLSIKILFRRCSPRNDSRALFCRRHNKGKKGEHKAPHTAPFFCWDDAVSAYYLPLFSAFLSLEDAWGQDSGHLTPDAQVEHRHRGIIERDCPHFPSTSEKSCYLSISP